LQSNKHDRGFYLAMWQSILKNNYWRGDIWDRRKDGSCYPKFLAITAIRNDLGQISNYSAIFYDVSERKRLEERLENLAHYDALTQLPNRTLLQDRLEQALLNCDRQEQQLALLFIDLDGFKPVNDQFGHAFGDEVLKEVARRLNGHIRAVDTAARLGGDEFVVILGNIGQRENAEKIARKLITALAMPYHIAGKQAALAASIGISLYPDEKCPASELLRQADEAMYSAKKAGKGRVVSWGGSARED
jgi:diguanylate cyclase (GGDEF)-like protein